MKSMPALFLVLVTLQSTAQPVERASAHQVSSSIAESKQRGLFKRSYTVRQSMHIYRVRKVTDGGVPGTKMEHIEKDTSLFVIKECWKEKKRNADGKTERYILFTLDEKASPLNTYNYGDKWRFTFAADHKNRPGPKQPGVYKFTNENIVFRNNLVITDMRRTISENSILNRPLSNAEVTDLSVDYYLSFKRR